MWALIFFDPEKRRIKKNDIPASRNRSSSEPEQEFQRAGTGVPARLPE
jgi:hypothetical protein